VVMMTVPVPPDQDSLAEFYDANVPFDRFKRNIIKYNEMLYAHEGKHTATVIASGSAYDTQNNSQRALVQANSRSDKFVEKAVHPYVPADSGFKQIADSIYAFIKNHA